MYVKKFEGESLDQTLKAVKKELGPDAIILKTITNKGLAGAFKKNRIEITAAISEDNYKKKAKVDRLLKPEEKEQFYNSSSSIISEAIHGTEKPASSNNYAQLALNRPVKKVQANQEAGRSLDDFLGQPKRNPAPKEDHSFSFSPQESEERIEQREEDIESKNELKRQVNDQSRLIQSLERSMHQLEQEMKKLAMPNHSALEQLKTTLKTFDITDSIVSRIIKKAQFELSKSELEDADLVYDFALREIHQVINVQMPLFSRQETQGRPVITVMISEAASGQSTMASKLAVIQGAHVLISNKNEENEKNSFGRGFFSVREEKAEYPSEMITLCRKNAINDHRIVVDFKSDWKTGDETKKFLELLRKSFPYVEVILCLSAIHSEIYNRKMMARYSDLIDGVNFSHIDLCLNFGAILNVHSLASDIPLLFFGTGKVIPEDIETASVERIMGGIFKLD